MVLRSQYSVCLLVLMRIEDPIFHYSILRPSYLICLWEFPKQFVLIQ
nr:MAG TPA: hypothetical protein [Caudoviricetes sp.]